MGKVIKVQGYELDDQLVNEGAPISFGKNKDGTQRVAILKPMNSAAYEDRLNALNKASGRAVFRDKDIERENQIQAIAEKCFIRIVNGEIGGIRSAWYDSEGEVIEDSCENRIAILADRNLLNDVVLGCAERETFRRQQLEADLGNSPKSSTGS